MNHSAIAILVAVLTTALPARTSFAPAGAVTAHHRSARETFDVGMLRVDHLGAAGRPPIIFVPALFCGPWQWDREIGALADRYDIYVLTLPGFDSRPRDTGGDLMGRAVADLASLIAARQLDKPVLVGHSLGGTLSVLFAETHPTAIRAVIAAEGGYPVAATPALREQQVAASTAPYVGLDRTAFTSALREKMLRYVATRRVDVDRLEMAAARSDPAAVVDWMRSALLLDLTPGLSRLQVPLTEIIPFDPEIDPYQGHASLDAKREAYEAWVAHAPRGGTVTMVSPSRHFVMLDQPEQFDRALFAAIERAVAR